MKIDWVAETFSSLRDCGEDISIVYGKNSGSPADTEPRWFELQHNEYDGVSGLARLLREQGLRVEKLPVLRDDRLTFFRGLQGVFACLPGLKVRRQQWKSGFDWTRPVSFLPVNQRVAWRLFTEAQTESVVAAAKAAGVTVNTYLLFHLDRVVSAELTPPTAGTRWMIPVNLRGAVTRPAVDPPQMSFLAVDVERGASARQLQASIDRLKRNGFHWGMWLMLQLSRLVGVDGMRREVRKREKQEFGATGMFSNLGVWDIAGAGNWIFCPATTRSYPVGAGCITISGRMAVTMQLHDGLGRDLQTSRSLLEAWSQACLQETVGSEADTDASPRRQLVNA